MWNRDRGLRSSSCCHLCLGGDQSSKQLRAKRLLYQSLLVTHSKNRLPASSRSPIIGNKLRANPSGYYITTSTLTAYPSMTRMPKEEATTKGLMSKSSHLASLVHSTTSSIPKKRKSSPQPKFYAVRAGRIPGVYLTYTECEQNITGFKNATFKSFVNRSDAEAFVAGREPSTKSTPSSAQVEKFYGVASGRRPGVYTDWAEAQKQIVGWKGPRYKKFPTREEAETFVRSGGHTKPSLIPAASRHNASQDELVDEFSEDELTDGHDSKRSKYFPSQGKKPGRLAGAVKLDVEGPSFKSAQLSVSGNSTGVKVLRIYTDGSSLGNGKNGATAGLGVYFGPGDQRNLSERLSGETQTNQRAELSAILRALELAPSDQDVQIVTDSKYSIDCITLWYKNWERNNWQTSLKQDVLNKDLIQEVLAKISKRNLRNTATKFLWVKGHSKEPGNEAADRLAVLGAQKPPVE